MHLAMLNGKELFLMFADDQENPPCRHILRMLADHCPDVVSSFEGHMDLGFDDPNAWFLLYCSGDYKRKPIQDMKEGHFLPMWHSEQTGRAQFDMAQQTVLHELATRNYSIADKMQSDELDEEEFDSMLMQLQSVADEKELVDFVSNQGFVTEFVPGDGNCALWSCQALLRGKPRSLVDAASQSDVPSFAEMRADTCLQNE